MYSSSLFRWSLIAIVLAVCGCSQRHPAEPAVDVRPAYVTPVRLGDIPGVEFVGEVRAVRRADMAFAVAGKVVGVSVESGDHVTKDQVLARLDEQPLRAQLTVAGNDVMKAEAALREVRLRADRLHVAQRSAAISASELSGIDAELAAAESTLRSARAQQDVANWSLDNSVLRAPFAGVVAERVVEIGQAVAPGMPLLKIDGQGRELSLLLPAKMIFKPGDSVLMKGQGQNVSSQVLRVNGRLEAGGLRRVFFTAPDGADVGSTWSVALHESADERGPRLFVPLRAVQAKANADEGEVIRIGADGQTTEVVMVQLGTVQGDWVRINHGLNEKDRLVVAGAVGIPPGTKVKPVPYPEPEGNGP